MSPAVYAWGTLASSLIPAAIGVYAWQKRSSPESRTLAALMLVFTLWALAYGLELITGSESLYRLGQTILLAGAPLWLVFTLRYTGRERWASPRNLALVSVVPLITLALIWTSGWHGLMWAADTNGPWFWMDLVYRSLLVFLGVALLVPILLDGRGVYGAQSLALLAGFLIPWTAIEVHRLGAGPFAELNPAPPAFVITGLTLGVALFRYRLLDISPVTREALFDTLSDGTLVLDRQSRVSDLNPAAERILGSPASSILGRDFREVMSGAGAAPLEGSRGSALLRRYEARGQASEEIKLGLGEQPSRYEMTLSAIYGAGQSRTGQLVVLHEITGHEPATGQPGKTGQAAFYERLGEEISRNRRNRDLLALLFLKLDGLESARENLGRDAGDILLKETTDRVVASVREYDVTARLGDNDLAVILPDLTDAPDATRIAERILEALSGPFYILGRELHVTAGVGICFYPTDGDNAFALTRNAGSAAGRAGKSVTRHAFLNRRSGPDAQERSRLENDLRRALKRDEFTLHYQPIVRVETGKPAGVEALARWKHPEKGLLPPADFLPAARHTGLIFPLERWVLREACGQMRSWQELYPADTNLTINVNLSPEHLRYPGLVDELTRILEETDLPPENLLLEVTEKALEQDTALTRTLESLKRLGIKLAIDNLVSGSSSLPGSRGPSSPDLLKVDRSLISRLHADKEAQQRVSAIVSQARNLNVAAVASGVESNQQLEKATNLGCKLVQGNHFTRPLAGNRAAPAFLVSANLYR